MFSFKFTNITIFSNRSYFQIYGCALNQGYTSCEQLIESVRQANVHNCAAADVEFAVAVYVHPYMNNILSVWISVSQLLRKRM
ncbi:unnamed protein product [Soboliphyme baturini]|uniref:Centrosomal protein of 76 kDa C-terminal domain-containing protein n=1 Tax=Soboliphyme baturini TaxID=241478 RepID=A0A3P8CIB1_9BILA|nr:unnamed protein product [Soboliphyme baturini]